MDRVILYRYGNEMAVYMTSVTFHVAVCLAKPSNASASRIPYVLKHQSTNKRWKASPTSHISPIKLLAQTGGMSGQNCETQVKERQPVTLLTELDSGTVHSGRCLSDTLQAAQAVLVVNGLAAGHV